MSDEYCDRCGGYDLAIGHFCDDLRVKPDLPPIWVVTEHGRCCPLGHQTEEEARSCYIASLRAKIAALEAAGDEMYRDYLEALADPAITTCCDSFADGKHSYGCGRASWREVRDDR